MIPPFFIYKMTSLLFALYINSVSSILSYAKLLCFADAKKILIIKIYPCY